MRAIGTCIKRFVAMYDLSFRGKLWISTTVLLLAGFPLPVMAQEVVVGREVVEVVEGEKGEEVVEGGRREGRAPAFDNCVVHTGRGFESFQDPSYARIRTVEIPARRFSSGGPAVVNPSFSLDPNDTTFDPVAIPLYTGSFTFTTGTPSTSLGLDSIEGADGLDECTVCQEAGAFREPDPADPAGA